MEALREAALEAVEAHGMRIFVVCDFEIARLSPQGSEPDLGGHAGALETSRLLALRGELVRGTPRVRYRPPPPGLVAPDPELYFPDGVRGDPTKASMELGQRLQEAVIQALVELVEALKKEGP
jgi:creatinine amidohydrolase